MCYRYIKELKKKYHEEFFFYLSDTCRIRYVVGVSNKKLITCVYSFGQRSLGQDRGTV